MLYHLRLLAVLAIVITARWELAAQPVITALFADPLGFSFTAFPVFTIENASGPIEATAVLTVRTERGEFEVSLKSERFYIASGTQTYAGGAVTVKSYSVAPTDRGRALFSELRLGGGTHEFCLELITPSEETEVLPYCDMVMALEDLWLDLVQPWNGDTIEETRPVLSWTSFVSVAVPADIEVRLVLAPSDDMEPARGLAVNTPLFMLDHLKNQVVPYPTIQPDLQRGHCYAWQVEGWKDRRLVERTEPWRFCVRKPLTFLPEKYVLLHTHGGHGTYKVVDGFIYFRTDERYTTKDLKCTIISPKGEKQVPVAYRENEGAPVEGAKATGVNLYELDLQPYGLKQGDYELNVVDGSGRQYSLRFAYVK